MPVAARSRRTLLPADRYLERELSWLQFNERVLQLAMDPAVPLLERTRFLAIFANNLDEYFMVRVAGLKRRIATGLAVRTAAGLEPRELIERIARLAHELMAQHALRLPARRAAPPSRTRASPSCAGTTSTRTTASRCTTSSPTASSRC